MCSNNEAISMLISSRPAWYSNTGSTNGKPVSFCNSIKCHKGRWNYTFHLYRDSSKPVRPLFLFGKHKWKWNPRAFWTSIDSNATEIVRTSVKQSMWHQWFNCNFTKLREYILCANKTKIPTLFNNSSPPSYHLPPCGNAHSCVVVLLIMADDGNLFLFSLHTKSILVAS